MFTKCVNFGSNLPNDWNFQGQPYRGSFIVWYFYNKYLPTNKLCVVTWDLGGRGRY